MAASPELYCDTEVVMTQSNLLPQVWIRWFLYYLYTCILHFKLASMVLSISISITLLPSNICTFPNLS